MTIRKPLRLWPAVIIAIVQLLVMFGGPIVAPDAGLPVGMLGGIVGALAIVVWWMLFSRAPWSERVGAIILMIVAVLTTRTVVHESIAGAGMGRLIFILPLPYLTLALVAWAVATRHLQDGARRASLVAAIMLACAPFALIRTAGVKGGAASEFHWRWTPTPEQLLLAQGEDEPKPLPPSTAPASSAAPAEIPTETTAAKASVAPAAPAAPAVAKIEAAAPAVTETPAEWPGFRGPGRDGIIRGVRIVTDWSMSPPVAIWRRPIGPGWSSFAVRGHLLYTQEQRGDDEVVSCYEVSTGELVWRHRDAVRFYESNGGAGPRGTPTLSHGAVYSLGATGMLKALDAATGAVVWSRNAASDTGRKIPEWGIASSPLVVDDIVVVAVSGTLAAYDLVTGKPRWVGPQHGGSYSSPQLVTIDGVAQILLLSAPGAVSVAPADGALLWEYSWEGGAIVQPALT
ncbi:MAG TPA: PQQ-binding-like beta-propeller repeat protein, partial [Vicinamibacterales bacterium]|nr:PQQ-binding-like beta-propeller repeat protein [Vicinamibacterales bacterium]